MLIAPLADPQQQRFAAGGILPGYQPQRGGKITPASIVRCIADVGQDRAGGDRADAGNTLQTTAGLIVFQLLLQLGLDVLDFISQLLNLPIEAHHHPLQTQREWVLWVVQQRRYATQAGNADRQTDAKLQQKAMNLIGHGGALANQRIAHAVQG
ncbi:hypothetical protein D3C86_1796530 [compost metagenome]